MSPSEAKGRARLAWSLGVRARLLLAFFIIAAFAVLAAAAGMYAFREVGGRLAIVDARVPQTLSALELSRSAERIIAAAPALFAASDRTRRDAVKAELAAEVKRLDGALDALKSERAETLPVEDIEPIVSSLTANLASLDDLVARRLATNERIGALRRSVFRTNDETQRLLAPWLQVVGSEIGTLVAAVEAVPDASGEGARLASLVELQQLMRSVQAQVSGVADMLIEASTSDDPPRLEVLAFQLGLALRNLEAAADGLDARLRPIFLEQVAKDWLCLAGAPRNRGSDEMGAEEQAQIARFASLYLRAQSPVMREVEKRFCGCSYGATSWTTAEEAHEISAILGLRPGFQLLDLGAGSGWPGLFLAKISGCDVMSPQNSGAPSAACLRRSRNGSRSLSCSLARRNSLKNGTRTA